MKKQGKRILVIEDERKLSHILKLLLESDALKKNILADGYLGTCRHGSRFRYIEEFIEDLSNNYVSAENLRSKLKLNSKSFQRLIKREGCRVLRIGRRCFVHKQDYI